MDTADLRSLALELRQWDEAGASRITSLADAVDAPTSSDGWAGADARDAVGYDGIIDRLHDRHGRPHLISQLERLRNLLVLVPILVTWLGLMYAASAYSEAVTSDPSLSETPFLLLWEQGFAGHGGSFPSLSWMTLSTVARIDVIVIIAILVLTWIVHGQTSVAVAAATEETRDLEARLDAALWQATVELRSRGSMSAAVDRFGKAAKGLLDELKAERTHLEELVNGRERRMNDMRAFAEEFRVAAADLSVVSHQLAVSVGTSVTASQSLAANVQQISSRLASLETSLTGVASETSQASGSMRDVATAVGSAMGTVADAAGALAPSAAQVAGSTEVLRREIADLRTGLQSRQDEVSSLTDRQVKALEGLGHEYEELRRQLGVIEARNAR